MYRKVKYILLILFLIGLSIFCYGYYQNFNGNYFLGISEFHLKISALLLLIILIYFALSKEFKLRNSKLTIIAVGTVLIFLFYNLNIGYRYYNSYRYQKITAEYRSIECEKMKEKFEADLKNNELKFFSGGMFYNETLAKNLKKLGIEDFSQGCVMSGQLRCYSDLVVEYLEEEKNLNFKKLSE